MDLTRRGLIARGTAAAGALVGGALASPGLAFAGAHGEAVLAMRLPRSGRLQPSRPFELIAIERAAADRAEVRALGPDGQWSAWLPLHAGAAHGPDRPPGSGWSDPVWTGPARAFELRARRSLRGARVLLVDPGQAATASAGKRFVQTDLPAGPGQPPIIARSSWATASCRPRVPAVFGEIDLSFVHHTVSSNHYRPSQAAGMVRAICLFHKYGNGWNDIGYNFVVDRYGQIFEGRAGGVDEAIVGAHAGGYNLYSSGVALLGNFAGGGPPRPAFDALAELLAWKLTLHGLDTTSPVTVRVTRDGAPYSRYRAGTPVHLNRIAGHRDGDTTECPGNGMYRQLPQLRRAAARLAATPSSLTLALQGITPGDATVGGILTAAGEPIAGAVVEVESRSTTQGPTTLATATTNPDGTWSVAVPLQAAASLRAVYRGDAGHAAVVSAGVNALVPPQINLAAASQQAAPGSVIEFSGSIVPAKPKLTLVLSLQQPDGTFTVVRSIRFGAADDGTFTRTVGFPDPGQYQVIAHTDADEQNALGTSAPVAITIA